MKSITVTSQELVERGYLTRKLIPNDKFKGYCIDVDSDAGHKTIEQIPVKDGTDADERLAARLIAIHKARMMRDEGKKVHVYWSLGRFGRELVWTHTVK